MSDPERDAASDPSEPVAISSALVESMFEHALRETPDEACGILAGNAPWTDRGRPLRFYATKNADRSPYRYRIDPEEQLRILLELDDHDEVVWGIFHSHTHTPAEPSETDLRLAFYPGALYLIASLTDAERPEIRGWAMTAGDVREVTLEVA